MSRKLVQVALTAASRQDLVGSWARLGFTLNPTGDGFALADGVVFDFLASDAPGRQTATVGLILQPGDPLPQSADSAAACFQLADRVTGDAPAHANGALGLRSVVAVADNPADHAEYLSALTGQREMLATSAGLEIQLEGGASLDVLSPRAFAFMYDATPAAGGFHIAGLVFGVKNTSETENILRSNGLPSMFHVGRLTVGKVEGVAVGFERA
ncbi:hypothetical protein [Rhodoblastus sp.]|uniref:hypothetical protein n=1 Tax=Rhodoblastus sp. TaxID=1962975 RepID=UPI0026172C13|nr:hypothetical protein [Rhodoblastus sp.]